MQTTSCRLKFLVHTSCLLCIPSMKWPRGCFRINWNSGGGASSYQKSCDKLYLEFMEVRNARWFGSLYLGQVRMFTRCPGCPPIDDPLQLHARTDNLNPFRAFAGPCNWWWIVHDMQLKWRLRSELRAGTVDGTDADASAAAGAMRDWDE